jgi:HAE1 family hydrophobic/amphiphilic exporter-1
VAAAVLVSLFVSFTLDPMLSSIWHDPEVDLHHRGTDGHLSTDAPRKRNFIQRVAQRFNDRFEGVADRYPRGLSWALAHRPAVVGMATLSIVTAFLLIGRIGFTWLPDFDGGEFNVGFRTTPGSALEYTMDRGLAVARVLRKNPEVEFTYLNIGGGFRGGPNNGSIYVRLSPKADRARSQQDIQTALRRELPRIPGVRANINGTQTIFGGYGQPIRINVQGPEASRLKLAAAEVLEVLRRVPGVAEPQSSEEGDIPQLDVRVDRDRAWAAGLGIGPISATIQPLFTGLRATEWEDPQGYSHDVIVIYPDSLRASAADVANIVIPSSRQDPRTGQPAMVPLSEVAEVRPGVGPQQIERSMLERQVSLSAGVLPGFAMGEVADAARAAIDSVGLPAGYRTVFRGDVQNLEETKGYVLEAIVLAVVFIYLILASLFGSFLQPLAIMLALPLSFIGVAVTLLATGGSLNVYTMIGIIMLLGLVTKNGILLVDFANQQREAGMVRRDALLTAARTRLRPIIMTTAAMIFGMVPLAMALGEGAEQRAPMGRAVIGGLITSTILTLFVVPVAYTLLDDLAVWMKARFGSRPAGVAVAHPEPVAGD